MKKIFRYSLIYCCMLCASFATISCEKTETLPTEPILGLGGDSWEFTELDQYLYDNYVRPYNIEVLYKWDPYEVNYNKNLVPPLEDKVVPVMETIKAIWMDPYENVASTMFLKKYHILKFVLVGSAEYEDNGSLKLGLAEGGNKITLLAINQFSKSNKSQVLQMLHTIHHEFAHILHQNIPIPQEWRGLSTGWYTATWFNTTTAVANSQGLITNYAKSSEKEDFVETIACLLVEGQGAYDAIVAANPDQASTFRRKEEIIVNYYKAQNIDFRELQREVAAGIQKITQ